MAAVLIDQEECIGCASCAEICLEVFGLDEDSEKAYVQEEGNAPEERIQEAIDSCPSECISRA
jgi:ferredoxin